jgi:P4 family phage/plasmid primase-like protien
MYSSDDDSDMCMTEADIHLFYKNKEPEPEPTKEQQLKTAIFRKVILPDRAEIPTDKDWELIENMNQEDLSNLYYSLNKHKYIVGLLGWYEYNDQYILKYVSNNKTYPISLLNDVSNVLKNHVTKIRNQITPSTDDYKFKMKIYKTAYNKLGSSTFIKGVMEFLKKLYYVEDIENKLNSNNLLFPFNNCVYDMTIKNFRKIKPEDYISITTQYPINQQPNPEIRKEINDLLKSIFEEDELIEYFKIISGLGLFTTKQQKLFIHTGSGGNGKGILSNVIRLCLGQLYITGENTFLTTSYKAGAPNPTLADAQGKRYLSISEPDNGTDECKFNIDLIKTITGGDPVTARGLYKDNVTYIPQFSLNIQCNNKPNLSKLDDGILRRINIIPYKFKFVDNPKLANERKRNYNLIDRIKQQDFINEFIIMLIEKATEYIDKDVSKINIPSSVLDETKEYIEENNPIINWLQNNITITNNQKDRIKTSDMHRQYNDDEHTERRLSAVEFSKYMKFNGFEYKTIKGYRYYIGCIFDQSTDQDEEMTAPINHLDFV